MSTTLKEDLALKAKERDGREFKDPDIHRKHKGKLVGFFERMITGRRDKMNESVDRAPVDDDEEDEDEDPSLWL